MKKEIFLKMLVIIIFMAIYQNNILSQEYDGIPCSFGKNLNFDSKILSKIKENKSSLELQEPFSTSDPVHYQDWASSQLKSEYTGKINKLKSPTSGKFEINDPSDVRKSCMYSAASIVDNNKNTAWAEGVEGDGIGEMVFVHLDLDRKLKIWSGFGKNDNLFKANNRPDLIGIHLLIANKCSGAQDTDIYSNFTYVGSFDYKLDDLNDYQKLVIPKNLLKEYKSIINKNKIFYDCYKKNINSFLIIEIKSVYKGTKYSDTLISEIAYD
ncbi:Hypothetical protein LBF_2147 [Leptospira biflexa serovar Patoc strain 'Patoc 1 (Ames)']|jgi:hypothetical protein|uniref:NAD glycohydrolase translocation F5/8 type C domain-containing protein n=1 Tax=Leptospira biflexa serovar Patoc (strain Patoc 1 / ATCC 23582 / Paris) TaxID=456481 RepID=B0ST67_LEPBP|nr:hypothetical protein [Leptospira biflexa]ABZ94644.1 Hypothetical protein LBF_2147 [Leptospira biflexa serovar Patoc strain 'Patoc 1 (Ames)']ABZ98307.1 Conserved hypothetical protein [Leptospira biflexa serovar Patoc strain 'Patoc 1 (Paris)']